MLMPVDVVRLLDHDHVLVREHAVRYLAESHDPAPATADDFTRQLDRRGVCEHDLARCRLGELPQTASSIRWVLRSLEQAHEHSNARMHLLRAMASAPIGVLQECLSEIESSSRVPDEVRQNVRERLALAAAPLDTIWREFLALAQALDPNDRPEHAELARRLHHCLASLADRPDESVARAAIAVVENPAVTDWREWKCIELLGEMRWVAAVEPLVQSLREHAGDGDIAEPLAHALAQIGDPRAAAMLADSSATDSSDCRLFAPIVYGRIRHPICEQTVLRLLPREPDETIRSALAHAGCALFPTEADLLNLLLTVAREGTYDRLFFELDHDIAVTGVAIGFSFPERRQWLGDAVREHARMEQVLATFNDECCEPKPTVESALAGPGIDDAPVIETYHRVEPKIGRNQACPCGSGRKFKQCCLRAPASR
jgi:hypothetical protein